MRKRLFTVERATRRMFIWSTVLAASVAATLIAVTIAMASQMAEARAPQTPHVAVSVSPAVYMYTSTVQNIAIADNSCVNNVYVTQTITVSDTFIIARARVGSALPCAMREAERIRRRVRDHVAGRGARNIAAEFRARPGSNRQMLPV